MSAPKNTPPPWDFSEEEWLATHELLIRAVGDIPQPVIAQVDPDEVMADEVMLANGKLIRAAPVLATQLQVLGLTNHLSHEDLGVPFESCKRRSCKDTVAVLRQAGRLP